MDVPGDKEDVDVFVSPKRFGGHTPAAKATRQKVFEDNLKRASLQQETSRSLQSNSERLKYTYRGQKDDPDKSVHRKIGRNNKLSVAAVASNYIAVLLGIPILVIGIWIAWKEKEGGIAAYVNRADLLLRSPVMLGLFLVFGGVFLMMFAYFFGVRHLAPSINEGIAFDRRRAFVLYQLLAIASMILLAAVLISSIDPLRHVTAFGVTKTKWIEMSVYYPDRVCKYEVDNECAGYRKKSCQGSPARINRGCPGRFCTETCKTGSPRPPRQNTKGCKVCYKSFERRQSLDACHLSERKNSTSIACLAPLKKDLSLFFALLVITSSSGLVILFSLTVLNVISYLVSFDM